MKYNDMNADRLGEESGCAGFFVIRNIQKNVHITKQDLICSGDKETVSGSLQTNCRYVCMKFGT